MKCVSKLVATLLVVTSIALVATVASASIDRVSCHIGNSHTWSNLGGDPVWKGGINAVSQLGVVVKSAPGQRSLVCLGLNQAERKAVTSNIAKATSCVLPYGKSVIAMAFHSDGASVDRPTRFVDSRYKKGAPSFCLTVKVKEGKSTTVIKLLWPKKCVNAALISETNGSTPGHKPKKPGSGNIGNCNVINSPGGQACNTNYIINVCGTQIVIQASSLKDALNQQNAMNQKQCPAAPPAPAPTPTPAPPTNPTPPSNPPPSNPTPKCTDHSATNYGGALPCQYPPAKCTDTKATNYGGALPCKYPPPTCTDHSATNYGGSLPCQYPPPPKCTDTKATNYGGPLPCKYPPPPPPATPPTLSNLTSIQEVYPNESRGNVCVDVSGKSGDNIIVTFGAQLGSISGGGSTSSGSGHFCATYTAPSETGSSTITVTATDTTSGLSAAASTSVSIIPAPSNPG